MDDLNVIESQKINNCIVHICDNSFAKTISEEKQIWEKFSKKAYKLYTAKGQDMKL